MPERSEVFTAIETERDYQDARWNASVTNTGHLHSQLEWLAYIRDYTEEAMHLQSRLATPEADKQTVHILRRLRR